MILLEKYTVDWKGYIPAISIPFFKNGEIDWEGWSTLLNWFVDEGMHGLVVNGTTGEWFSQSLDETAQVMQVAAEVVQKRIPLIAGCTDYSARQVVERAKIAKKANFDGILVAPPPYIVLTKDELLEYYQYISDNVDLPICIYNWPRGTNVDMDKDLIIQLADMEKIVAIKNSTGDMQSFLATFFAVRDKIRVFGFPMNEFGVSMIKDYGAAGIMGAGAVLGSDHPNFFNSLWNGDIEKALYYGRKDQFLFTSWFNSDFSAKYGSPQAIVKTALNLRGLPGGYPRLPILPLTKEQELKVKETLEQVERL